MNPLLTRRRVLLAAAAAGTALPLRLRDPTAPDRHATDRLRARQRRHRRTLDRRRSGASSRTAGRAIACTRSTCPTRSRATTTRRSSPAAARPPSTRSHLAAEVKKVLAATGAAQGRAGRQLARRQRDPQLHRQRRRRRPVSHAVLGGVAEPRRVGEPGLPSRQRVQRRRAVPDQRSTRRRAPAGNEVTPGVAWLTIRSDNNDKYAQPDGVWIGARGTPTNVSFDGPALKGAENVVIAGIDHRETAFGAKAFAETYRFITGKPPATLAIAPEARVVLDGTVSGLGLDNRAGQLRRPTCRWPARRSRSTRPTPATGERVGPAAHRTTIGADGRWGPFVADGRGALRVRHRRAGLRDDAHLSLAVPALVVDRQPAPGAPRRRRPRREVAGHAVAAARLLRRAARSHRARRHEPAGGHPERRRRRVDGAPEAGRCRRRAPSSASSTTSASSAAPGRSPTTTSSSSS